eukprot:1159548-Pelagomonas_calceolata.AAC.8
MWHACTELAELTYKTGLLLRCFARVGVAAGRLLSMSANAEQTGCLQQTLYRFFSVPSTAVCQICTPFPVIMCVRAFLTSLALLSQALCCAELKLRKRKMVDLLTEGEDGISIMEYLKVGGCPPLYCGKGLPSKS